MERARLGALLEEVGTDHWEVRTVRSTPCPNAYRPRHMYFAPADLELWGHSADTRFVRCAAVSFEVEEIRQRIGVERGTLSAGVARIRFVDETLWLLIKLLTEAIDDSDPTTELYGDSLTVAIASKLLGLQEEAKSSKCGLSPVQLSDAMSYLDAKLPCRVSLAELADLAGLSQSHYSRAFKASTGFSPYQWQLQARIERAQNMMINTNKSLDDIAENTGFADSVHFGRTFRNLTGATPAAWRSDRLS